jgi:hypothetical protein
MVVLYTSLEDLIAENDRRYEEGSPEDNTTEYATCLSVIYLLAHFYCSDKIACSVVTLYSRRFCHGYMQNLDNLISTNVKIC